MGLLTIGMLVGLVLGLVGLLASLGRKPPAGEAAHAWARHSDERELRVECYQSIDRSLPPRA